MAIQDQTVIHHFLKAKRNMKSIVPMQLIELNGTVLKQMKSEPIQHWLISLVDLFSVFNSRYLTGPTLSLENHQDGVYLHRHGVTLSLQAILVCSTHASKSKKRSGHV